MHLSGGYPEFITSKKLQENKNNFLVYRRY